MPSRFFVVEGEFIQRDPVLEGVMTLDEWLIKKGFRKGRCGRSSPKKSAKKKKAKKP